MTPLKIGGATIRLIHLNELSFLFYLFFVLSFFLFNVLYDSEKIIFCSIILFNYQDHGSRGRLVKNEHIGPSISFSYSTLMLISQTLTMISNFLEQYLVFCTIKTFYPFNMLSSSNGNDSELSEQTETFNSSKNQGWIKSPSSEDKYDPDW